MTRDLPEDMIFGMRPEDTAEAGYRPAEAPQTLDCNLELIEPAGADTFVITWLGHKDVTPHVCTPRPGPTSANRFDLSKVSYGASGNRPHVWISGSPMTAHQFEADRAAPVLESLAGSER